MRTYLLGTSNKGKIIEIKECLADLPIVLLTPDDLPYPPLPPHEEMDTFEENAIQKAQYYFDSSGIFSIADDSGILVEALKNELGIHTRRWGAGPMASDEEWITYFLNRMKTESNKRARFTCVIALIDESGEPQIFHGHCDGIITESLEAAYLPGLPISACFKPDGFSKVFSALSIEEKNRLSHRGKAVRELRMHLET
ncbi:MAG TPA: non-canonical purine NTP pyrophosphatase [Candidatus Peribacterales bacterium]|nr:non-canonical purine NTP pyrophosphatase [Candidatus Peribacterales bacterium]